MTKILEKFDRFLSRSFQKLGQMIANKTGYFLVIPIMVALLFGTGIQQGRYETNPEFLFSPTDGPAKDERKFIDSHFSTNFSSSFDPSRITKPGRFIRLILTAKDGETIMKEDIWKEIMDLDEAMKTIEIEYDDEFYGYKDVCAVWNGECYGNKALELNEILPEIINGSLQLNYPVTLNPYNFNVFVIPAFFGGLTKDEDGEVVTNVKAILLNYWLKSGKVEDKRSEIWEAEALNVVQRKTYDHTNIAMYNSKTLESELQINTASVIPYLGVTVSLMIIFSVSTLFMSDWVRSKAYLGFFGVFSVLFSCIMTFGMMMYAGVPFIGMNLAVPFLMLGIGIDDMFVMLAAWRRTRLQDPVEKRLKETYAEAAVSITITSLTDMFSFFIGVITPFPSVQIFCIYIGTAVFFTYLWQITFFGACMAVAGRMEAEQRHALCCFKVKPKSVAKKTNMCYSIWCAGGISLEDPWNQEDNKPHAAMRIFRDVIAERLNTPFYKGAVIFLFMVYLCGAIYGLLQVREGLERRRLSRYDSYSVDFYDMEDKYFRDYPYRIQVVLHGDINYGDSTTKAMILELHQKLENQSFIADNLYTESWIKGWYEFLDNNARFLNINFTNEEEFIRSLRDFYLSGEDNVYKLDVEFNEDFTRILASRFVIQAKEIYGTNQDKAMMTQLREIVQQSPLNVTVYHPMFIFFDQFVLVKSVSIKTVGISAALMMIVSLIFIPNPLCSLWVGFSIVSIELGVVGYMTLWGVNLDSISMINLIMCTGFSVDFSAHVSYAYIAAKVDTTEERVKECLFGLGFPILQGAISTILSVATLTFAPSYIFITFFKTVFLVIFFGALHGIFLLPVLLSILGPGSFRKKVSKSFSLNETPIYHPNTHRTKNHEMEVGFKNYFSEEEVDSNKDQRLGTFEESLKKNSLGEGEDSLQPEKEHSNMYTKKTLLEENIQVYSNKGFEDNEIVIETSENNSHDLVDDSFKQMTVSLSGNRRNMTCELTAKELVETLELTNS